MCVPACVCACVRVCVYACMCVEESESPQLGDTSVFEKMSGKRRKYNGQEHDEQCQREEDTEGSL